MPLNVTCPGCLKRFQVSDKFAGQKGPCPDCKTIIEIPKAAVKFFGAEPIGEGGHLHSNRVLVAPLQRIVPDFDSTNALRCTAGAAAFLLGTAVLGFITVPHSVRAVAGFLILVLAAFPLSLFGYLVTREREQLFLYTGQDLYRRTAITALGYIVLWLLFECYLQYTGAFGIFSVLYLGAFACFGMFFSSIILEIPLGNGFVHFFIFAVPVIILRYVAGLGWLAGMSESVLRSSVPAMPLIWN